MVKIRAIETNEGIQNEVTVEAFDAFARSMRDKGWNGVDGMIASGIKGGDVLEVGPGPGYVGLELAKKIHPKSLTGCEISPAMLRFAEKNAAYTISEMTELLRLSSLRNAIVSSDFFGLCISGQK